MEITKIFISSVFGESFEIEREVIRNKINANKYLKDISLDYGEIESKGTVENSIKSVQEAEIIILLVGYSKYGGQREAIDVSLTHLEYRKARELNKELLVYFFPISNGSPQKEDLLKFIDEIIKDDITTAVYVEELLPGYKEYLQFRAGNIPNKFSNEHETYKDTFGAVVIKSVQDVTSNISSKLPVGVSVLNSSENESIVSYKKSLFEYVLPYISRAKYKKSNHLGHSFKTEDELFKEIFSDQADNHGVLIKGEGGIGKTRLMLELGRMAENSNWTVLEIHRNFNNWDSLKLSENKRYCLLFDYAEQSKIFSYNMFDTFSSLYPRVKIKIIANARNTYREDTPLVMKDFQIDQDDDNEKNYLQYVIKSILEYKGVQFENIDLGQFFKNIATKPSFAVFLINEKQNIIKNINFHGVRHINQYLQNRLKLTLSKQNFSDIPSEVFKFLSILPINEQYVQNKEFINFLEIDGWIKYKDGELIHAFHNTILDELLISYLRTIIIKRNLDSFIRDIFDYSLTSNTFHNAIKTFNSMSTLILNNNPKTVSEIPKFLIILFQQEQYIKAIENNLELFIKSSIFSDLEKLYFLLDNKIIAENSDDLIWLLTNIMKKPDKIDKTKKNHIIELVYKTIESNFFLEKFQDLYKGSFLIPAFYIFFTKEELKEISEKYNFDLNEITLNWINRYGGYFNADFVMKAYLENSDSPKDITNNVRGWLKQNSNQSQSFLIQSYLDSKTASLEYILDIVLNYLKKYYNDTSYSFVLESYLQKGGSIDLINEDIIHWLNSNYKHVSYSYISKLYLNQGGNLQFIKESIIKWINDNYEHINYNYMLQVYLKNSGDISLINENIVYWLKNNNEHESYSYILQFYLNYGGNLELIKDSIVHWLNSNYKNESYSYILQAYLNHGGSINSVRLDNIYSIFTYVVSIFYKNGNKKNYQEYLSVYYSNIEGLIDQYHICDSNRENDIKYLFICSKFLKLSNITEKIRNKVLNQFQIFVDKDNYFLNKYKLPNFDPYNAFKEHGAETIVKENLQRLYEDYIINQVDYNSYSIKKFYEYLSKFTDQDVKFLERIKRYILEINIKELDSVNDMDIYIRSLEELQNVNMLHDIKKYLSFNKIEDMIRANPTESYKLLKSYFQYTFYNDNKSKILFLEYINQLDHISNTSINTKLYQIVKNYFTNNDYNVEVLDILKQLILQNSTVTNIYKLIVLCILNGEDMNTFKSYFASHKDLYEAILNEIHLHTTHPKEENLKELKEFLSIKYHATIG